MKQREVKNASLCKLPPFPKFVTSLTECLVFSFSKLRFTIWIFRTFTVGGVATVVRDHSLSKHSVTQWQPQYSKEKKYPYFKRLLNTKQFFKIIFEFLKVRLYKSRKSYKSEFHNDVGRCMSTSSILSFFTSKKTSPRTKRQHNRIIQTCKTHPSFSKNPVQEIISTWKSK